MLNERIYDFALLALVLYLAAIKAKPKKNFKFALTCLCCIGILFVTPRKKSDLKEKSDRR